MHILEHYVNITLYNLVMINTKYKLHKLQKLQTGARTKEKIKNTGKERKGKQNKFYEVKIILLPRFE